MVFEKNIFKWPHPNFNFFVIISPLKKTWPFIWTDLNPLYSRMISIKFDSMLAQWFWRRRFLNDPTPILHFFFVIISTLKRTWSFIWTNLYPLHPRMICIQLHSIWPSGSGEKNIKCLRPNFTFFVIISPLKRTWPFIWTNLNPLHLKMICTKFDWIWPNCSGEHDF